MQTGFGKARSTGVRGVYKVVVRSRHEQVTRAALHAGRELVLAAIHDKPFDVAATVARLHEMVDSMCLGPSTACIVDAATERGIPSIRLTEGNLVQLGYGIRQHRIWTAETDQTSAIAEGISRDKDLTKSLLSACGVPVPEGRIVDSPADAWEAAEEIGVPVVVKPSDGNHGRGVSTELMTRAEIEAAYPSCRCRRQRSDRRTFHPRQRAPPAGGRRASGGGGARRIALAGGGRPFHHTPTHRYPDQHRSAPRHKREFPPRCDPAG